jgi:hypothetical protein
VRDRHVQQGLLMVIADSVSNAVTAVEPLRQLDVE